MSAWQRLRFFSYFSLAFQHPVIQPSAGATGDAGGGQQLAEIPGQPEAAWVRVAAGAVPGTGAAAPGALRGRGGARAGLCRVRQRAAAGVPQHHPGEPLSVGSAGTDTLSCWGAARPSHRNCSGWAYPLLFVLFSYSFISSWSLTGKGLQVLTMYKQVMRRSPCVSQQDRLGDPFAKHI